ncbi:MAG: hypothetical protein OEV42_20070 [Deltaproteobacteria bacterium]|nr:hypothetical protein [Deltaproteobacteria bacterium]
MSDVQRALIIFTGYSAIIFSLACVTDGYLRVKNRFIISYIFCIILIIMVASMLNISYSFIVLISIIASLGAIARMPT